MNDHLITTRGCQNACNRDDPAAPSSVISHVQRTDLHSTRFYGFPPAKTAVTCKCKNVKTGSFPFFFSQTIERWAESVFVACARAPRSSREANQLTLREYFPLGQPCHTREPTEKARLHRLKALATPRVFLSSFAELTSRKGKLRLSESFDSCSSQTFPFLFCWRFSRLCNIFCVQISCVRSV